LSVSLILGVHNLWKLRRNKVNLEIDVKQKRFDSESLGDYDERTEKTKIGIEADIRNKGLEPTSISKVMMYIDYGKTKGEMFNDLTWNKFKKIRIEANDRKSEELNIVYPIFIPKEIKEVNAEIIFHTTYKNIIKKIKLTKEEIV